MLKARRQGSFVLLVRVLIWLALRRRFQGIYLIGAENLQALGRKQSLVVCANHTNWWDGFVAGLLTAQRLRKRFYVVQEERHLRRYWFFRFAGAFGVDLDAPGKALATVRHAQALLKQPGAAVWIFPQGKLMAPDEPIRVRRGATYIAARAGAAILPCALRYEFRDQENPFIFVAFGRPLPAPAADETLQAELQRLVREAKRFADPDVPLPECALLRSKLSINELWDACVALIRGLLRRRYP
ncbi:MAG: lysophospholipid acyltransferase family protein [Verrucomicrobia bacterium]|nr:lysophospholipid acyltransferase family protein [Verrucomicrobiota bacterium]